MTLTLTGVIILMKIVKLVLYLIKKRKKMMIGVDENIYFLYKTTIQRQILFFKVSAKLTILRLPFI